MKKRDRGTDNAGSRSGDSRLNYMGTCLPQMSAPRLHLHHYNPKDKESTPGNDDVVLKSVCKRGLVLNIMLKTVSKCGLVVNIVLVLHVVRVEVEAATGLCSLYMWCLVCTDWAVAVPAFVGRLPSLAVPCICSCLRVTRSWHGQEVTRHDTPTSVSMYHTNKYGMVSLGLHWFLRWIVIRGDAWPMLLSPCNTHQQVTL